MSQKQHNFQSLTIEMITVLLASILSFPLSDVISAQIKFLPFVMVACYVVLKLVYHLCVFISAHIIFFISQLHHRPTQSKSNNKDCTSEHTPSIIGDNDILMKRMVLFHYEYKHEEQQYLQQKEKEEDEKLHAVLQYTINTFRRFNFDEEEIFQICECVRYFVTNRQVLINTAMRIKRRTIVTQISIKNFAWNIAFQYDISRDVTALFVMQTFHEWFANSTIDTIRKNLRTTTGKHKIPIDEHIVN